MGHFCELPELQVKDLPIVIHADIPGRNSDGRLSNEEGNHEVTDQVAPDNFLTFDRGWYRFGLTSANTQKQPKKMRKVMTRIHRLGALGCSAAVALCALSAHAQAGDPATLIKEKLVSQIKLTKASAAHDDIVTAGDVIVLQKDGLMMCSSGSSYVDSNTYVNGLLRPDLKNRGVDAGKKGLHSMACKLNPLLCGDSGSSVSAAASNSCTQRKFVAGEKFWVTDIKVVSNGIEVDTFSDPFNDVRYFGEVTFPLTKGAIPSADAFAKTFSEVMTVQSGDSNASSGGGTAPAAPAPGAAAEAAAPPPPMAPIAPPPPPADAAPPTIEVGQTVAQVVAAFGQPTRIMKPSATKQIYVYKDMKVTFAKGIVSNVE
jgi:hypothetical protein